MRCRNTIRVRPGIVRGKTVRMFKYYEDHTQKSIYGKRYKYLQDTKRLSWKKVVMKEELTNFKILKDKEHLGKKKTSDIGTLTRV